MSTPSEHSFLTELGAELARALGEAVWAYAKIEWLTYEYIENLGGSGVLSLVGDKNLNARISILRKLVERHSAAEQRKEAVRSALSTAAQLAETRNTLVHNPWQIYVDIEGRELVTEIYKRSNPTRPFKVSDISTFIRDADAAYEALAQALQRLVQT